MDENSEVAGVPSLLQRDQRRVEDAALVGATQAREPQTAVLRLWSNGNCRGLRAGGTGFAVVRIPHDGSDRALSSVLPGLCGIEGEKVPLLPSKAPFSKRFDEAVGQACESASVRRVARQFGLAASTVRAIDLRYLRRWAEGRRRPALWQMAVDELYLVPGYELCL